MLPPPVYRWHHHFDLHVRVWRSFKDYASITGEEPQDHEFYEQTIYVEDVVRATARHFGLTLNEIKSKRRTHAITRPRQIGMFISKTITPRSLPEIGRRWGGFDHTTVISAIKRTEQLRAADPATEQAIQDITASLKRGIGVGE
jgi:chromosomal replication initiation ATPase DnaA